MTIPGRQPGFSAAAFLAGLAVSFLGLTAAHEAMLRVAGHEPGIVDDEALWCSVRRQVATLGPDDVVLLGASRMQTDLCERTIADCLPGRRILNLAISGGETSLPVFRDIVEHERFAGTMILDETEASLATDGSEQAYVDAYRHTFTLDRLINRGIETWLQKRLVCLAPEESCVAVWPRLAATGRVPPPKPTITSDTRYTRTDFSRIEPAFLDAIRRGKLPAPADPSRLAVLTDRAVTRWLAPLNAYRRRGGRVVFVRLPVSAECWSLENAGQAATTAWCGIMDRLTAPSIPCNASEGGMPEGMSILDSSHLDAADLDRFTRWLCDRLRPWLERPPSEPRAP